MKFAGKKDQANFIGIGPTGKRKRISTIVGILSRIASALLLSTALIACDKASSPLKWTEDVRLPDGRILTLTRYQEFKGPRELGNPPTESDYWFEFKHPDTGQVVRWEWDRTLETLALMMNGKDPMLLVIPNFGGDEQHNCPNPPYLLYRFEGGWKEVSLEQIPVKRLRVNMTFVPSDSRAEIESSNYHLSAEQTSNSMYNREPFVINFSLMRGQTFGIQNCGRNPDWLIER